MTREVVLERIKMYFEIHELVGKWTYRIYGEKAWKFLDLDLLEALLITREGINRPFTANNWFWAGRFSQRGLRTIMQQIVRGFFVKRKLYLSAHMFGKAVDFTVEGMTATEVREWIVNHQHLYPSRIKIRLEQTHKGKEITWVHLDTFWELKNPKVYLFAA